MLKIEHISKTFNPGTVNEKQAIRDLSLNLEKGDFATIIGSNGAGKSTLFNAICGDFLTDSGSDRAGWRGYYIYATACYVQKTSDACIRIRCGELLLE